MGRILGLVLAVVMLVAAGGGVFWIGAREGWFGVERDAGVIRGARVPEAVIQERARGIASVAPEGGSEQSAKVLVHAGDVAEVASRSCSVIFMFIRPIRQTPSSSRFPSWGARAFTLSRMHVTSHATVLPWTSGR